MSATNLQCVGKMRQVGDVHGFAGDRGADLRQLRMRQRQETRRASRARRAAPASMDGSCRRESRGRNPDTSRARRRRRRHAPAARRASRRMGLRRRCRRRSIFAAVRSRCNQVEELVGHVDMLAQLFSVEVAANVRLLECAAQPPALRRYLPERRFARAPCRLLGRPA